MVIWGEFLSLFSCLAFVVSLTGSHFLKFAGGAPTISEEDFARVLLRHTTWDMDPVFNRLKRKEKPETVSLRKKMWRIQLQLCVPLNCCLLCHKTLGLLKENPHNIQ